MPIYEYRCDDCGHELEKLQRISDDPLRDCPSCEQPALRRLVSAAGFRLKGSGWYETDFKKDNRRNLAGDGKKPEDGGKSDGKASATKGDKTKVGESGSKSSAGGQAAASAGKSTTA
jgi:putative FmdB family regulatory protein